MIYDVHVMEGNIKGGAGVCRGEQPYTMDPDASTSHPLHKHKLY